jgi:hypothetical protein
MTSCPSAVVDMSLYMFRAFVESVFEVFPERCGGGIYSVCVVGVMMFWRMGLFCIVV